MPLISVLMPAKNAASTIRHALSSTLRALPSDSEILVWDDASSDGTAEAAAELKDPRIRVTRSESSVGSGVARRGLMDASDSKFVACMDADDICLPWRFTDRHLPTHGTDIKFSPMLRFGRRLREIRPTRFVSLPPGDVGVALLVHNPLAQPTMIASRAQIESIGGYSGAILGQDYELWLRAASAGLSLERAGAPTVAYRVSPTQVTRRPDYRSRFTADEHLTASYRALIEAVLGGDIVDGKSDSFFNSLRAALRLKAKQMSRQNSRYYLRLLDSGSKLGLEP